MPPDPDYPAKWYFDVQAGFGNDVAIIQPCIVPGLDLSVVANLGDGDDTLDAAFECPAARGRDHPAVRLAGRRGGRGERRRPGRGRQPGHHSIRCGVADVHVGIRGFGGDDSGIIIICNVAVTGRLTQFIDLGGGDDTASYARRRDRGRVAQAVGDRRRRRRRGRVHHRRRPDRVGAPEGDTSGDGDDLVSLIWKTCEILGPAVPRVSLGEGDDDGGRAGG